MIVLAGSVLRFVAPSGLWLDEALSVNISKLPPGQMMGALVWDGSPPLYYLLLHVWMLVFGQGGFAVRALSGVISLATLPFMWFAGRRIGGRSGAWACLLLAASSPWAIYYGSYTRMYSLMALESVLYYLALQRAIEAPTKGRLACTGALTAGLLYTHYWDLYLVGVVGLWMLWRGYSEARYGRLGPGWSPGAARGIVWSMVGAAVVFLPWSPIFVFQALHTGTPWSTPPGPQDLLFVFGFFAGTGAWAVVLGFLFFALVALGVMGRPGPRPTSVVLELQCQPRSRPPALLLVGTLVVAVSVGSVTGAAFDQRYIAVVFPLFIVMCAIGLCTFASPRLRAGLLAAACLGGLVAGQQWASQPRTQAVQVAADLNAHAKPGDMVVYCPDQLGPAVDRLLDVPGLTEVTFPRGIGPQRVDWVNYVATIRATNVSKFATAARNALAPGATLWFVYRNGYQGLGNSCADLYDWFKQSLPGSVDVVDANPAYYEYENLVAFPG